MGPITPFRDHPFLNFSLFIKIGGNKAANQRFDSCEPAIKVGNLCSYTKKNTDPPRSMLYNTGES